MIKTYNKYKDISDIWLGKIPEHWNVSNMKHLVDIINGYAFKSEDYTDEEGVPIIRIGDISKSIDFSNAKRVTSKNFDELDRFIIKRGDLLLAMTGATIGKNAMYDSDKIAFVNQRVGLLRGKSSLSQSFLKFYIDTPLFREFISLACAGSAQENISSSQVGKLRFALPPLNEQTKIAQYLDHQTSTIDKLIEQKEKLIALLKEKRQAVINEAVTKGLDPNVKMKDSGIEWLGKVPKHWKVARIGHYTQLIRGASPRPAGDPRFFGGDYMPWITVGEVTNGDDKFVFSTESYLTKEGSEQSRIIYPETLLLSNSGATLGVPKISKITGCINDGSVAFIYLSKELERDFLFYFFITHTEIYRQEMSGYGQPNLNTDIIKSTPMPLPPMEEQKEIVKFIENCFKEYDTILTQSKLQIEKLKEYRQSIISEAVTGKIDVRDWQPNN